MTRNGNVSVSRDIPVRMRDGATLFADVYAPEGPGPFPVLLMRTPYGKTQAQDSIHTHPLWYARRGYIVAVQDVRGRWSSEGEWYPFAHEHTLMPALGMNARDSAFLDEQKRHLGDLVRAMTRRGRE